MEVKVSSSNILRFCLAVAFIVAAAATAAHAQNGCGEDGLDCPSAHAPEIGLGSMGSAVTLLSGGYFVIASKLRRKK